MDLEQLAKALCKGAYSSLSLDYNYHKTTYETLKADIEILSWPRADDFASPEEMQRAIETDSVWTLEWYPESPAKGSYVLHAHSLEALIKAALSAAAQRPSQQPRASISTEQTDPAQS
jgi:hypothetical protein